MCFSVVVNPSWCPQVNACNRAVSGGFEGCPHQGLMRCLVLSNRRCSFESFFYYYYFGCYVTTSVITFLVRIKVTCPADRHVVADARSTEAKVKWSEDDFEVESSNPVRWVQL